MKRACESVLCLFVSFSWLVASAGAESIDFEDVTAANDEQPTLFEEYAHLGIHFDTSDDGVVWGGVSAEDPGGWQLEGTQGPQFLGFDGSSYSFAAQFDWPVQGFQLDVARAHPHPGVSHAVALVGMYEGEAVEVAWLYLGAVDDWMTLGLEAEVDEVHLTGMGFPTSRFGIDNIRWEGPLGDMSVAEIDIRPGSDENRIRLASRGVLPVVLYGGEGFDVTGIDRNSCVFGPADAPLKHRRGPHREDVDEDGHLDLVLHFRIRRTGITESDEEACLHGEIDGQVFEACDSVQPMSQRGERRGHRSRR